MDIKQTLEYLESANPEHVYPIFVPSIFRPGHYFYQHVIKRMPTSVKNTTFYVVRENEYKAYKEAQPDVEFVIIRNKDIFPGFGLDSTRKIIEDTDEPYPWHLYLVQPKDTP